MEETRLQNIIEDWVATLNEDSTFDDGLPKYLKVLIAKLNEIHYVFKSFDIRETPCNQ